MPPAKLINEDERKNSNQALCPVELGIPSPGILTSFEVNRYSQENHQIRQIRAWPGWTVERGP